MLKRCSEDGQAVGRELPWALEWEHCWPRPEIQAAAEWHRAAERTEEVKLGLKKIDPSMRGIVVGGNGCNYVTERLSSGQNVVTIANIS